MCNICTVDDCECKKVINFAVAYIEEKEMEESGFPCTQDETYIIDLEKLISEGSMPEGYYKLKELFNT